MQGITDRQARPALQGEELREAITQPGAGPRERTWMERYAALILGAVVILLSIALVAGGVYARGEINDQEAATLAAQQEAQLLTAQRDDLTATLATTQQEADQLAATLETTLLEVEGAEARLSEQLRLTSQAREEASRQQAIAADALATAAVLEEVVALDEEILYQAGLMIDGLVIMIEGMEIGDQAAVEAGAWQVIAAGEELEYLFAVREELVAELE
jgi:hypothetical protein